MQILRDYQRKAAIDINEAWSGGQLKVLLNLPTGGGKTSVAAHMISKAVDESMSVMFIAHRKELIEQCSARLDFQGVPHGIIKAGNKRVNNSPVQVASIQTLINRIRPKAGVLLQREHLADLIIIDECHRAMADTYMEVLKAFPKSKVLGLTATPYRTDGNGLGDLFDTIVSASSVKELTELGFLVPAKVFTTPMVPDFSKIKMKMGEFDKQAVSMAMDTAQLVGDVYAQWVKHAEGRQTVIFASSCEHARTILSVFSEAGVAIGYLDGVTPEDERTKLLKDLESGALKVVVNMGVLTEGWDCPPVSCVQIARPTKSLGLYLQMAGRALRPFKDKKNCIIIDHGGNTMRHGLIDEEREVSLDGDKGREYPPRLTTCFKCNHIHQEKACPECGHENKKPKPLVSTEEKKYLNDMQIAEGDLEEVDLVKILERRKSEIEYFRECIRTQCNKGLKTGFSKVQFMQKFGRWPGKEIGVMPIWGTGYSGGPPKGYRFQGVEYLDK